MLGFRGEDLKRGGRKFRGLRPPSQWSSGTEISSRPGPGRDSLHPGRDRDKNKITAGTGIRVIPAGTGNFASKIEPFLTYRTTATFHEFMQYEIIHVRYI